MNQHQLRPLAALAIVALIAAGCGGSAATGTATGTATGATGATTTPTVRQAAMKFSQCMRDNGVSAFPDPEASGELTIDGVVNGSDLDTSGATWKQAIAACRDLQPAGFTGHKRNAEEQDRALVFAQCIRENGVKDFPDPTPGEPLVNTYRIPSSNTSEGMAILNAAMRTCGDAAEKAIGSQP